MSYCPMYSDALGNAQRFADDAARLRAQRGMCAFAGVFLAVLMVAFVIYTITSPGDSSLLDAVSKIPTDAEEALEFGAVLFIPLFLGTHAFFAAWGFAAFFSVLFKSSNVVLNWVLALFLIGLSFSFSFSCGWMCFLYQWWKIRKADKASQEWLNRADAIKREMAKIEETPAGTKGDRLVFG